jgi:hypothetical protein
MESIVRKLTPEERNNLPKKARKNVIGVIDAIIPITCKKCGSSKTVGRRLVLFPEFTEIFCCNCKSNRLEESSHITLHRAPGAQT